MNKERLARSLPGIPALLVLLAVTLVYVVVVILYLAEVLVPAGGYADLWTVAQVGLLLLVGVAIGIGYAGLTPVNPNEARALVLFGHYNGSLRSQGFHWVNPFTERRKISVRVRNFETSKLKVNDKDGNPIEIAAVVVWKVTDTAEALFEVDDYENFVHVQAESALRNLATSHPYDTHREDEIALRSNQVEISDQLRAHIQDRLEKAGLNVIEARISHLAYAPEIANAMLRRQQAKAVIAARTLIVEGAVGMVEMAL
ncbi:MAG TPA: SPFH domain-containing protein, partial [Candidatus Limnocylindrales bacterium]